MSTTPPRLAVGRACASSAPAATARSSIAGAIASITHNTSFGGGGLIEWASAAEDAQARVLLAGAHAAAIHEDRQQHDRHVAKRV